MDIKNLDFSRAFNVLVSRETPQLYREENLAEINMFLERFSLHSNFPCRVPTKPKSPSKTKMRRVLSSDVLRIKDNGNKQEIKNATREVSHHQSETSSDDKIKKSSNNAKNNQKKNTTSSESGSSSIVIPELPKFFKAIIILLGGTDVTFMMQKEVNKMDLECNNNRLAMPEKQINEECKFLALKDPMRIFEVRDENSRLIKMEVGLIEPFGHLCDHVLKRWNMTSVSHL